MGACYEHLGYVERLAIADEQRRGLSIRAIARMLKPRRCSSAIANRSTYPKCS